MVFKTIKCRLCDASIVQEFKGQIYCNSCYSHLKVNPDSESKYKKEVTKCQH